MRSSYKHKLPQVFGFMSTWGCPGISIVARPETVPEGFVGFEAPDPNGSRATPATREERVMRRISPRSIDLALRDESIWCIQVNPKRPLRQNSPGGRNYDQGNGELR